MDRFRIFVSFFFVFGCVAVQSAAQTNDAAPDQTRTERSESQAAKAIDDLLEESRKKFVEQYRSGKNVEARASVEDGIRRLDTFTASDQTSEKLADARDTLAFYLRLLSRGRDRH